MMQKIVTVGAGESFQELLGTAIDLRAAEILSVPSWESACSLHEALGIDLLVVVLPLEEMTSGELASASRALGLPRLVVIAGEDDYRMLSQRESDHLTVLPARLPAYELVTLCSKFVRASPRAHHRIMARLEGKMDGTTWLRMVQTHDISVTGMKVASRDLLPPGTFVQFSINWPDDPEPISGDAEVMRHTSQTIEGIRGMGIRFTAFEGLSAQRLREQIRQRADQHDPGKVCDQTPEVGNDRGAPGESLSGAS